jgi:signal transduction histidine kinase
VIMRHPSVLDAAQEVMNQLQRVEQALGRLPEGPGRAPLAGDITALREALERRERLELDERYQLGHDLRVPLNTIAGWTHILRLDAGASGTVLRATEVFDRNVRALTRLIESYTDPGR